MKKRYLESVLKRIYDVTDTEIACIVKIYSSGEATSHSLAKLLKKEYEKDGVSCIVKNLEDISERNFTMDPM